MKRLISILLLGPALLAADSLPRIYYSKSFPGSTPAFVAITVDKSGAGEYKEAPDDDNPLRFRLRETEAAEIFALAEKLSWFSRPLESPAKVAFMGTKTFRVESGPQKGEVKFNYSEDLDARALADWFERITESELHLITLERAAKYDKLGVNKALLQLQASFDRKRLVGLEQFLPMLDRISKNDSYLHMARERASGLAEQFRALTK